MDKGWTQRYHDLNEHNSWSKTFPKEEVPVKVLFKFENLPISAEKFAEMCHPVNMETRKKWDKAFGGLKLFIPARRSMINFRCLLLMFGTFQRERKKSHSFRSWP